MGLNPLILACLLMLACGITNITPWGGPTARAASALHLEAADLFVPMLPAMAAGAAALIGLALVLGRAERRRLGTLSPVAEQDMVEDLVAENDRTERPALFLVNLTLTATLMVALVSGALPLPILFMLASAAALLINYPSLEAQKGRIAAHAPNILPVITLIFAAGIFTGILNGTGMTDAMAGSVVGLIPPQAGPYLAPITGLISMPFTFFVSNDAFFFGILPILAEAGQAYGIAPVEIGRAALTSQAVHLLSPLVPSTYLLVGLVRVELAAHQAFTLPFAIGLSLVILVASMVTGVVPLTT